MAIDIIARAAAQSAVTTAQSALSASGQGGTATPSFLFTTIASKQIDAATSLITSSGYAASGRGVASYVSDALATAALAAAKPRCCKRSADGRYWRLIANADGAINVAQTGAIGSGNDQPAFQAALDYAAAMGIQHVKIPDGSYDLWCSARTTARGTIAPDGSMLSVSASVKISAPNYAVFHRKGPTGGDIDTDYQTVEGSPYRGGGIHLFGNQYTGIGAGYGDENGWNIQWFEMENIEIDGGAAVGGKVPGSTDTSDKGVFFLNAVRRVTLKNCHIHHFYHEILYGGNYVQPVSEIYLERVKVHSSGHSALNFQMAKKIVDVLGEYGNSYIAAEQYGANYTFIGTRFYDSAQLNFSCAVPPLPSGQQYDFPYYTTEAPKITLIGVETQNVDTVYLGSQIYGDLNVIDGMTALFNYAGNIDLRLRSTLDQKNGVTALLFQGATALPTGAATGYLPRNIKIELTANVTRKAEDAARKWNSVVAITGYLDPETCHINIIHADYYNHLVASAGGTVRAMPFIETTFAKAGSLNEGQVPGETVYHDANFAVAPYECGRTAYAGVASIAVTFASLGSGGAYEGVPHGQRYKFFYGSDAYGGGTGKFTFAQAGANMALSRNRTLWQPGDWLEFEYNERLGKWTDAGGYTTDVLTASATWDAPSIANAASTTTTIGVADASLGDRVEVAFAISLAGLVASAYVSAAGTVTVVLYNPTGAAVDLASTTVSVTVRRA